MVYSTTHVITGPILHRGGPAGGRSGSDREHAADQGLPGDRADDAVHGHRWDVGVQGLLEAADQGFGHRPEDPVDLRAVARLAGAVHELFLDPAHGVALVAALDGDDEGRPGVGAGHAVDGQPVLLLERTYGGAGGGPEDAVHGHRVAAGPEQVLQGLDRVLLGALADERPRLDGG